MISKREDKSQRPRIRIVPAPLDWVLEITSLLLLTWMWAVVIYGYQTLPDIIPSHFNIKGEVDDYGSKTFLWFIPILSTGLFILLTFINRIPHSFNYLVTITPQNAARQYFLATRMLRVLKTILNALFLYISHRIIQSAIHPENGPSLWLLPFFLISLMISLLVYLLLSTKK